MRLSHVERSLAKTAKMVNEIRISIMTNPNTMPILVPHFNPIPPCPTQRPHPASPGHELRPGNGLCFPNGRRRDRDAPRQSPAGVAGLLDRFQILCIPGGFSFGDDVAAGQIFAVEMRHHLAGRLAEFKAAGKLILGICNGFQVIIKSGILLDDEPSPASGYPGPPATLTYNDSGKYEDRWVRLVVAGDEVRFPSRHRADVPAGGPWRRQVHRPRRRRARPLGGGRSVGLALCCPSPLSRRGAGGEGSHLPFPDNPNGSMADVAGTCDTSGRVLGLMPHPERHLDPTHHPRWTRGEAGPVGNGLQLFINAVRYFL